MIDLDEPLYPDPAFPIEPKDSFPASELARVKTFRGAMRVHAPLCRVVAIPNAAARGQKALNQARAEGAAWGFPDLMVLHAGRIAFLEFKAGKTDPKTHQVDWMNWLIAANFPCGVFRTADAALCWLESLGFPVETRHAA